MNKAKIESSKMGQAHTEQTRISFRGLMQQLSTDFAIFAGSLQVRILHVFLYKVFDYLQLITAAVIGSLANRNSEQRLAEDDWKKHLCLTTEIDHGIKLLRLAKQIDAHLSDLGEISDEDVRRNQTYQLDSRLYAGEKVLLCESTSCTILPCSNPVKRCWQRRRMRRSSSRSSCRILA
jgi:hypothetical protein